MYIYIWKRPRKTEYLTKIAETFTLNTIFSWIKIWDIEGNGLGLNKGEGNLQGDAEQMFDK